MRMNVTQEAIHNQIEDKKMNNIIVAWNSVTPGP